MHGSAFLGSASAIASQGVPVFARRGFCVRNRLQPFATVCNRLQPFATVRNPLQPSAIRKLREEGYGRDSHFWRFLRKRFLRQHLQRFRFWLQFFWCITWPCVTLALQNMPPKARAPEARMAFQ